MTTLRETILARGAGEVAVIGLARSGRAVARLLATHGGNLSQAARTAQVGRAHLRQLARRYGLRDATDDVD